MVLVQKWPFFRPFLFLGKIGHENVLYDILEQLTVLFFLKIWPFFLFFFLGYRGQGNFFFYDILERKNAFLGYNNKKVKKSENGEFLKGVCPWVWFKVSPFSTVFLRN